MKPRLFIYGIITMLLVSSCATIFLGPYQTVTVNSYPQGAKVYVQGKVINQTTPCRIEVKRRQPASAINQRNQLVYTFKKDGYQDYHYIDNSRFHWLAAVDFIYYIVPGLIDVAVGAHRVYSSNISAVLQPQNQVVVKDTVVQKQIVYVEKSTGKPKYEFERKSDVDRNIPKKSAENRMRFALIIGNEDYSSFQVGLSTEIDVHFARNDASAFREYAINVLGVPEKNVTFLLDATTGQMKQAISKMKSIIGVTNGEAEVFVFYAGHGLPDEVTKEAYLMPVDVSGKNARDGIKLAQVFQELTEHPSQMVVFFIDACFSGGAREQGLLAARGVKVRPSENILSGNLLVFTASSGDQSALPYKEQHHGLFTFYLLKMLKEKQGTLTYGELAEYLKKQVSLESILINEKEQSPQINISPSLSNWEKRRIY